MQDGGHYGKYNLCGRGCTQGYEQRMHVRLGRQLILRRGGHRARG